MNKDDDKTQTHIVLTKGTMVSHYRIDEKIGAGGMGEVYLAEDTKLKRNVAIKFLPAHLITNLEIKTRFVREAQTVAKLNHPNIISIYDVSDFNGRPYYVMELVDGQPLNEMVSNKPLQIDMVVEYAIQLCQGLGEAHRAGIVHRDIKTANIVVDQNNRLRLLDFGLAVAEGDDKITKTGSTLGTVSYMSPEQVSGKDIDHRSDLFSFGVVLYELITGQTPFKKDNEGATLKAIIEDNPEPLTRYKSDVPEEIQRTVNKLLEKDKELRCQSAEDVIADLKRLMYDSQQSSYSKTSPPKQKIKSGLMVGILSIVVIGVVAISSFLYLKTDSVKEGSSAVPMIAVLPFENLGSPDDQYFADGMTDEITSRLAGINGLGVISRTSSMKYKTTDKSLKEIGAELGVEYILEGTVRWSKIGDQSKVRITPQLIQVSDDRHLWANIYERDLMEVFAVQADIAEKIIEQLGLKLGTADHASLSNIPTKSPEAYDLYLRALKEFRERSEFSSTEAARELLDSAVILDPEFALAHALRSETYTDGAGNSPESEEGIIALEAAERSLEIDSDLPQGHLAIGRYYYFVAADNEKALEHFSKAKSELYNDPELLTAISNVLVEQEKYVEALDNRIKAAQLDPLNPRRHTNLAKTLQILQRFDDAIESLDRSIALNPEAKNNYGTKISCLIAQYGDIEKVIPVLEKAFKNYDSIEYIFSYFEFSRYLPEYKMDSIASDFIKNQMKDTSEENLFKDISVNYMSKLDILEGNNEAARKQAKNNDEGTFVHWGGLLLSFAGDCEQAIEQGLQGKAFVEESDCSP